MALGSRHVIATAISAGRAARCMLRGFRGQRLLLIIGLPALLVTPSAGGSGGTTNRSDDWHGHGSSADEDGNLRPENGSFIAKSQNDSATVRPLPRSAVPTPAPTLATLAPAPAYDWKGPSSTYERETSSEERAAILKKLREEKAARAAALNMTSGKINARWNSTCTWPECLPRCEPCKSKQINTCALAFVSDWMFGCDKENGPQECFLGNCLCEDGFCANEENDRCVPQVCYHGATPPEFHPSWWVRFYAKLGGGGRFPEDARTLELGWWLEYLSLVGLAPFIVIVFGLTMASVTFAQLRSDKRPRAPTAQAEQARQVENTGATALRVGEGGKNADKQDEDIATEEAATGLISCDFVNCCQDGSYPPKRPNKWPMLISASVILLCTGLGIHVRQVNHARKESIITRQTTLFQRDAETVAEQTDIIDGTAKRIKSNMDQLSIPCQQLLWIDNVKEYVVEYVDLIEHIAGITRFIPVVVRDIREITLSNSFVAIWIPMVPLILMACVCTAIVVEAVYTSVFHDTVFGKFAKRMLQWSSRVFVTIILIVTIVTCLIHTFGITLGQYCMDIDDNVYDTIVQTTGEGLSEVHRIAEFYLKGTIHNPIIGYADMAEKFVTNIEQIYLENRDAFELLENACPEIADVNITRIASEARLILDNVKLIIAGDNIWPYYDKVVRIGTCDSVEETIGWVGSLMLIVGLVFFPICAILTHKFLVQWAEWDAWAGSSERTWRRADSDSAASKARGLLSS